MPRLPLLPLARGARSRGAAQRRLPSAARSGAAWRRRSRRGRPPRGDDRAECAYRPPKSKIPHGRPRPPRSALPVRGVASCGEQPNRPPPRPLPAATNTRSRRGCRPAPASPPRPPEAGAATGPCVSTSRCVLRRATSGWRRMVPVDEQGASSRMRSAGLAGRQLRASAATVSTAEIEPLHVVAQPAQPVLRTVEGQHVRPRRRQLRRLAARRRAQVEHPAAADVAQQPRRQRRRRVLNPPAIPRRSRPVRRPGRRGRAAGCRWRDAPHPAAPPGRRLVRPFRRQIERRLVRMRLGDRPRRRLAIGRSPGLPEPVGRVQPRRILRRQQRLPLVGQTPQHGVDQRRVRAAAAFVGLRHRGVHGGVRAASAGTPAGRRRGAADRAPSPAARAADGPGSRRSGHRSGPGGAAPSRPG